MRFSGYDPKSAAWLEQVANTDGSSFCPVTARPFLRSGPKDKMIDVILLLMDVVADHFLGSDLWGRYMAKF